MSGSLSIALLINGVSIPVDPLSGTTQFVPIDAVGVDAVLNEDHHLPSRVTKFPVESGATISDFIYNEPIEITIVGIASNFPIVPNARADFSSFVNPYANVVQDVYNALVQWRDRKQLGTLVTGLNAYTNMAMVDLQIPRDVKTGQAIRFTAQFSQMLQVASQTQTMPNARGGKIGDQASGLDGGKKVMTTPANAPNFDTNAYKLIGPDGLQIIQQNGPAG